MKCGKCGLEFENRSELMKHKHSEHLEDDVTVYGDVPKIEFEIMPDDVKQVVIPISAVEELKYLSKGQAAKLNVLGYMTDKGFVANYSDIQFQL